MTVLLASSAFPVAVVPTDAALVNAFPGLRMTWTSSNGTSFDLTDPTSPVALRSGVRGLSMPDYQRFSSESPSVDGSRWRSARAQEREVFWPVGVYGGNSSQEWLDNDRAFWRTMDPRRVGVWTVIQPNSETRTITCRFISDNNHTVSIDPSLVGWEFYGVSLVAEQPFWQGPPIIRNFKNSPGASFFGTGASPFTISSGNTLSAAQIDNPGDEDAYLVYTITGPSTSVTVRGTVVPFALAAGETLVIDTAPSGQTAITGAGVDRTGELGVVNFAPVAPGQQVPLSLAMTGDGLVSVSLTPLYRRAW